jgi:hypothetical protein
MLSMAFVLRALVGSLLKPSVYGLSAIPDMTANPIGGWPVALVPPAVQGMNWNAAGRRLDQGGQVTWHRQAGCGRCG